MSHATSLAPRPGRLRTITPPPPVLDWTREMASLEEAGPELAVAFWRVLRKVRAWAETPPEGRAGLFEINKKEACERLGAACGLAPGLVEAFGTFSVLVRAPGRVDARQLAEACHQVHEWAEERSLIEVAMLFAEAAAFADPGDPAWANDAGWMSRRAARDDRAVSWYHRAYGLSVRHDDKNEVIRALTGYGALLKDLGEHDVARRYYEKAATRAAYTGRDRQAAVARHYMLALEAEAGTYDRGERHARLALKLYPTRDERIPYLVHDFAFLLIRNHYYSLALPLLHGLKSVIPRPEDQLLVHGSIARVAAGTRRRVWYDEVEPTIVQLVERFEEYAPAALIHLAEGARVFENWDKAVTYGNLALEIACRRRNSLIERDALRLLESIAARESAPLEQEPADRPRTESLVRRYVDRLIKWRAPGSSEPGAGRKSHTSNGAPQLS